MLKDSHIDSVLASAQAGRLAIFVGAGASLGSPSYAPGWYEFRDETIDSIAEFLRSDLWNTKAFDDAVCHLKSSPLAPEMLFEGIDRFSVLSGKTKVHNFAKMLDIGAPNRVHFRIAALVRAGVLRHVVTSNWDTYVDRLLGDPSPLLLITPDLNTDVILPAQRFLLHLHGVVGQFVQAGIFRLGINVSSVVRKCLGAILEESDCLVIGYSGRDWDVIEELEGLLKSGKGRVFWIYRDGHRPNENVERLIERYPSQVYGIAMDLERVLSLLCEEFHVTIGAPSERERPQRNSGLSAAAEALGHYAGHLTLAFSCASLGQWRMAWQLCLIAADVGWSSRIHPEGPSRFEVAEAYRLTAACLACDGIHEEAMDYWKSSTTEIGRHGNNASMDTLFVRNLQLGNILMCAGDLDEAEKALWHARDVLEYARQSVSYEWPMGEIALLAAIGTLKSLSKSHDSATFNEKVAVGQSRNHNVWGYCCTLLSLALGYVHAGMANDAVMALQDCRTLSSSTGNYPCLEAATANIQLLEGTKPRPSAIKIPITHRPTGWRLSIDPFATWMVPPAYNRAGKAEGYGSGLHSRGTWKDD
jgi:hypothetical protein